MVLSVIIFGGQVNQDSSLSVIEGFYSNGQYNTAELEARRMFGRQHLSDSVQVQLHKWIAFSLIAQGKLSIAKEQFVILLNVDESFELDPILTSPKILSVFNEARVAFLSTRKNNTTDTSNNRHERVQRHPQSPTFRTILFPGWEQLYSDRTTSGYILLGSGVMTLSSGIIFEILRSTAREDYLRASIPSDISSKYNTYNFYRKAEIYSFSAFAIVYLISELEVFAQSSISLSSTSSNEGQTYVTLSFSLPR